MYLKGWLATLSCGKKLADVVLVQKTQGNKEATEGDIIMEYNCRGRVDSWFKCGGWRCGLTAACIWRWWEWRGWGGGGAVGALPHWHDWECVAD